MAKFNFNTPTVAPFKTRVAARAAQSVLKAKGFSATGASVKRPHGWNVDLSDKVLHVVKRPVLARYNVVKGIIGSKMLDTPPKFIYVS